MSEVKLQYNIFVKAKSKDDRCTPLPPIDCGCDGAYLVLKNKSKISSKTGIIKVKIVVKTPEVPEYIYNQEVKSYDYYWVFLYEFLYDSSLLAAAGQPIELCDVDCIECNSCTLKIVDGLLKEYVKTITGNQVGPGTTVVDNSDPQNPVIFEHLTQAWQDTNGDLFDQNEAGFTVRRHLRSQDVGNALGIGSDGGLMLTCASIQGCLPPPVPPIEPGCLVDIINNKLHWTGVTYFFELAANTDNAAPDLINDGDRWVAENSIQIDNGTCRDLRYTLRALGRRYGVVQGASTDGIRMSSTLEIDNGSGYAGYNLRHVEHGGNNVTHDHSQTYERLSTIIPAGSSAIFKVRMTVEKLAGTANYISDTVTKADALLWGTSYFV